MENWIRSFCNWFDFFLLLIWRLIGFTRIELNLHRFELNLNQFIHTVQFADFHINVPDCRFMPLNQGHNIENLIIFQRTKEIPMNYNAKTRCKSIARMILRMIFEKELFATFLFLYILEQNRQTATATLHCVPMIIIIMMLNSWNFVVLQFDRTSLYYNL